MPVLDGLCGCRVPREGKRMCAWRGIQGQEPPSRRATGRGPPRQHPPPSPPPGGGDNLGAQRGGFLIHYPFHALPCHAMPCHARHYCTVLTVLAVLTVLTVLYCTEVTPPSEATSWPGLDWTTVTRIARPSSHLTSSICAEYSTEYICSLQANRWCYVAPVPPVAQERSDSVFSPARRSRCWPARFPVMLIISLPLARWTAAAEMGIGPASASASAKIISFPLSFPGENG